MQRNLDLVREILILSEDAEEEISALCLSPAKWTKQQIAFHVELMQAYGLLRARTTRNASGEAIQCDILGLTWDGYDYLDAIRSETVWKRAKDAIKASIGETTLSVVKDTCTSLAAELIRGQLGIER